MVHFFPDRMSLKTDQILIQQRLYLMHWERRPSDNKVSMHFFISTSLMSWIVCVVEM